MTSAAEQKGTRGMTADEIRAARSALGLSAEGLARLVQVQSGRTVRKWEAGDRDVPGPVAVLMRAMLDSQAVRLHFGVSLQDGGGLG